MIAFITCNSNLVPLLEGLCSLYYYTPTMSHPPRSPRCNTCTHFLPLWVCSLFAYMCRRLCLFLVRLSATVICCQDDCLMAFAKGALPEEYLSHNFDEQCLGGH